ncbi:DNA cytosine methyltransferase [Riemerella anatipestifer]|nr:DNA cytosine methyltransferase [Riemerella anatipestifer]MDY3480678.1 DNA cytosine methyltransferase [Riemerella anatipestifer]MDY3511380.1 DNA cytosine methyltransferase [Riemerella anatipestifer]QWU97967.1 DNA cytosine methyltransferase [Riemerella anatipestifer]
MNYLKVATVCSGIGSPEQALKNLGIPHEIVFACEIDKYARQTYLANFKPKMMLEDMTKQDWKGQELYADLFIGGIPCQSFSLAGNRLGEADPRGLLFYDFYKYVKIQQPKYFIIENVKGLLSNDNGRTFRKWIELLGQSENGNKFIFNDEDSLVYNLHWQVLNTKDYGLPQNRERVFLVGIRNDLPNNFMFPKKEPLKLRLKDILEEEVEEKFYLSKKLIDFFIKHTHKHQKKGNGFKFLPTNGNSVAKAVTTKSGTRPDDNFIKIIQINPSKESGGKQPYQQNRIYDECGIMPALCRDKADLNIKTEKIRKLTPLECFRLQGFPDDFKKTVSNSQLYKQAGNTISVPVIEKILKNLINDT